MAEIVNTEQAAAWDGSQGDMWVAREESLNRALVPHAEALLDAAAVDVSDRVLDVGCGTGETTRVCARRASGGEVLGADLSRAMLDRARQRAEAEELANVTFAQADAQVHPFAAAQFDLVVSRFGVMFFADPAAAFANLVRATAAGGRFAAVVWQALERNEWVLQPRAALALGRDLPPIPADAPGPMGLADRDRTQRLLEGAGWREVRLDGVAVPYDFGPDVESAVAHARVFSMLRNLFDELDAAQTERAVDALREVMTEHLTPGGVRFDSQIWLVQAVR